MEATKSKAAKLRRPRLKLNPALIKDDMVYFKLDGPKILEAVLVNNETMEETVTIEEQAYWTNLMEKEQLNRSHISNFDSGYVDGITYLLFPKA